MKAHIDNRGCLHVEGEGPLEDYALRMWYENWGPGKSSMLYIYTPNDDNFSVAPNLVRLLPDSPTPACGEE